MKRPTLPDLLGQTNNLLTRNNTSQSNTVTFVNSKRCILKVLIVTAAFVISTAALPVAQAQYSLTDLGVLPGKTESMPAAVNNIGQVAGTSSAGGLLQAAFRFNSNSSTKDPLEDIGKSKTGAISRAFGINEVGEIVGDSSFGINDSRTPITHAALFSNGVVRDLGFLKVGGNFSRANDINAFAQVVGFSSPTRDGENSRAFFWSASTGMIDIGTLGGPYAQANAINDAGLITGAAETIDSVSRETHAFLFQPFSITGGARKPMQDLGTLGGSSSVGTSLNATNHVVGYSALSDDQRIHAFFYDGGMKDLGSLGAKTLESDQSFALGINVADQVVGYTFLPGDTILPGSRPAPQQVAFLYKNGRMIDLNTVIGPLASKYRLLAATAINDKAQIVAVALNNSTKTLHAVLLTPTGK
jgi:probable HAF family extracellular repeat protein